MRARSIVLWSGLWAAFVTGCYSPDAPFGVPCSASQECPDGQECDLLTNVCGYPTEERALRDDTATEFEGGTLDNAMIEAGGFVGPIPYFVQGVRATGITGNQIATSTGVTFEALAQLPATGHGVLRGVDIGFGEAVPALLGLTAGDDITVLVEGELWLEAAGDYSFDLRCNDTGFIDIAAPGAAFVRVADAAGMTPKPFTYTVSAPGWYRFRGAVADSMLAMDWELRYKAPNVSGGLRQIPDDIVRAPVADLDGPIVDVFDEAWLALMVGTGLTDKLDNLSFTQPPYGFDTGVGDYTLRWTAQFLVDTEGDYRFKLDTSQGHRAWIDGVRVANAFGGAAEVTTTNPIHLVAGWHDLTIDGVKTGGTSSRFSFTVESGPQFAGGGIPRDHLRPVSGRDVRFTSAQSQPYVDLVDGMTVSRSVTMDLPPGVTPQIIDASFSVTHPLQPQLSVILDPPSGANITMLAPADLAGTGVYQGHDVIPNDRNGTTFTFIAGDSTVDAMIGVLQWISVTTTYTGGRPPYDARVVYTSTVRDLDVARFGALTWQMRQAKAEPTVSVRTCDEETGCEAEPWTPVASGATPAVPARKYLQYRVEIDSSTDVPSSLDWIDLQYVGYVVP